MSGTVARTTTIRIRTEDADKARRELERLGDDGQRSVKKIEAASNEASPALRGISSAGEGAARALGGLTDGLGGMGRAFAGVTAGASGTAAAFALVGAAAAAAVIAVARAGDEMNGVMARLTSASGSADGAVRVYENLYRLSQQTGVSVAESAGAFSRFAVAAKEIGATNDQVLRLVGGIQKAGIIAGTSTEEANAAVQQLGQALASGVLQGDELRSLLENMPQLARALAQELNVPLGALREMGKEGKLTGEVVLPALLRASEKMGAEFEKMPPTMSRAFDVLGSAMVNFTANLDKALGLSQAIAKAVMAAAGAVNTARRATLPTEREAADDRVDAALRTVAQLEANSASGASMPTGSAARALGMNAAQLATARAELSAALAAQRAIRQQDIELQRADQEDARAKALAAAKERAEREFKQLQESKDKKLKIEKEYQDELKVIQKAEETGAIPSAQAEAARKAALERKMEDLDKLKEKVQEVSNVFAQAELDFQTGLLALSESDIKAGRAIRKTVQTAQETAAKNAEREAEKARERTQKLTDDIVQYSSERFADFFTGTNRGWSGLWESMKKTAIAAMARMAAEALIRPIIQPIVASFIGSGGGTGTGAVGSLLGSLGLGGGQLGSALGLGDLTSGIGGLTGFLNTPLSSSWGPATNAALGGMGGAYGPATLGQVTAAGGGGMFGTFGNLLGGFGAGFGAGSLLNGLVGGNALGGTVGSGLGAAAGAAIGSFFPGVGTLLGGLIGGAGGGLLGGLFGPGKPHHGWNVTLGIGADGKLGIIGTGADKFDNSQVEGQIAQQVATVNAALAQRGITASLVPGLSSLVLGGRNAVAQPGSLAEAGAFNMLRFGAANDNRLGGLLAGRSFDSVDQLTGLADFVTQTLSALEKAPAGDYANALKALNDQYDAAIAKAKEYAIAEGDLTTERDRRVADLAARRDLQAGTLAAGYQVRFLRATGQGQAADLLAFDTAANNERQQLQDQILAMGMKDTEYAAARIIDIERTLAAERLAITQQYAAQTRAAAASMLGALTYGGLSALAPEQKYFAGLTALNQARGALDAGGSLSDYTAVAQQVLPVARDFLGTSERYAGLVADVAGVVASKGGDPAGLAGLLAAQVDGTDALRDTFARYGDQQVAVQTATLSEIRRLASTIEALLARSNAA